MAPSGLRGEDAFHVEERYVDHEGENQHHENDLEAFENSQREGLASLRAMVK